MDNLSSILQIITIVIALISLFVAAWSLFVAILSFIIACFTLYTTRKIAKQQRKKQDLDYLSSALVLPYNKIETDIMMLADGRDIKLDHDEFDKEVLDNICSAKSYALMSHNIKLFKYLDGLVTGESPEKMGLFIEEYFKARKQAVGNHANGKILRDQFLSKTRNMRDSTLKSISRLIN